MDEYCKVGRDKEKKKRLFRWFPERIGKNEQAKQAEEQKIRRWNFQTQTVG